VTSSFFEFARLALTRRPRRRHLFSQHCPATPAPMSHPPDRRRDPSAIMGTVPGFRTSRTEPEGNLGQGHDRNKCTLQAAGCSGSFCDRLRRRNEQGSSGDLATMRRKVPQAGPERPPASPASPPLAIGDFAQGSSTGDGPTISLLWFKVARARSQRRSRAARPRARRTWQRWRGLWRRSGRADGPADQTSSMTDDGDPRFLDWPNR
jgi:hypothetical protein